MRCLCRPSEPPMSMRVDEQSRKVFSPAKLGTLQLRNRVIRAGCFEGMCPGGDVTQELVEHHRQVAAGGVAMTTVAYGSVSHDGRGFGHEMWMRPEIGPDLRLLTDAVHREGAAASIQLVHCGYFANPRVIGQKPLGASRKVCLYRLSRCAEMTEVQIQQKIDAFTEAAVLAKQSGFDAVEIHAGHGYLLSQFLSPWTNHRQDRYGGSLENRVRFPAAVLRHVREAVGPEYPVLVKVNQSDGIEGGLELGEAVEVARRFEQAGASALIPSSGFVAKTPLHMMCGDVPTMEMVANQANWFTKLGLLLFGRMIVQEYPFERMYLLDGARQIADAVAVPVVYVGGALSLDDMNRAIQVGLQFVQVGRATVRDPDFAKKLESGEIVESDCDHCNRCIVTIDAGGVYCVSNERGLVAR